jgi:hypothetical protein
MLKMQEIIKLNFIVFIIGWFLPVTFLKAQGKIELNTQMLHSRKTIKNPTMHIVLNRDTFNLDYDAINQSFTMDSVLLAKWNGCDSHLIVMIFGSDRINFTCTWHRNYPYDLAIYSLEIGKIGWFKWNAWLSNGYEIQVKSINVRSK